MKQLLILLLLISSVIAHATNATVESFGATGNGTTDDLTAINNALKGGYDTIYATAGKTYLVSGQIKLQSNVKFISTGAIIKPNYTAARGAAYIRGVGSQAYTGAASFSITEGSSTFTWSGASNLSVGQIVYVAGGLWSIDAAGEEYDNGLLAYITGINGNNVMLSHAAQRSFTATNVTSYNPIVNAEINGFILDALSVTDGFGMEYKYAYNCNIYNCTIKGTPVDTTVSGAMQQGISIKYAVNCTTDNCTVYGGCRGCNGCNSKGSYAIAPAGQNIIVSNSTVYDWQSGIVGGDFGYFTLASAINNNVTPYWESGINFHGGGAGLIQGNTVTITKYVEGITVRFDNNTVDGNIINCNNPDQAPNAIRVFQLAGKNVTIKNNKVNWNINAATGTPRDVYVSARRDSAYSLTNFQIYGNSFGRGIEVGTPIGAGMSIHDNWLEGDATNYPYIYINPSSSSVGLSYQVYNNTFINYTTSSGNYSIKTNTTAPASASSIYNNTTYLRNAANPNTSIGAQYIIAASGVTSSNNVVNNSTVPPPAAPVIPPVAAPIVPATKKLMQSQTGKIYMRNGKVIIRP